MKRGRRKVVCVKGGDGEKKVVLGGDNLASARQMGIEWSGGGDGLNRGRCCTSLLGGKWRCSAFFCGELGLGIFHSTALMMMRIA